MRRIKKNNIGSSVKPDKTQRNVNIGWIFQDGDESDKCRVGIFIYKCARGKINSLRELREQRKRAAV